MDTVEIQLDVPHRGVVDLGGHVSSFLQGKGDGLLSVFVPHATAGVAIIETGAGSDDDLMEMRSMSCSLVTAVGVTRMGLPVTAPTTCFPASSPHR